ncbi:hypothetical protein SUGI_0612990 [Cryptomeria japonica]|nr:hypothetical protein SUGI_0612990 [Cryptomeria japonica]
MAFCSAKNSPTLETGKYISYAQIRVGNDYVHSLGQALLTMDVGGADVFPSACGLSSNCVTPHVICCTNKELVPLPDVPTIANVVDPPALR